MGWKVKKISSNRDKAAQAVRSALERARQSDKDGGRGYGAAASAVEAVLQAFGALNGYSVQVETAGDVSADGKGYLTISVQTIDEDVIV